MCRSARRTNTPLFSIASSRCITFRGDTRYERLDLRRTRYLFGISFVEIHVGDTEYTARVSIGDTYLVSVEKVYVPKQTLDPLHSNKSHENLQKSRYVVEIQSTHARVSIGDTAYLSRIFLEL